METKIENKLYILNWLKEKLENDYFEKREYKNKFQNRKLIAIEELETLRYMYKLLTQINLDEFNNDLKEILKSYLEEMNEHYFFKNYEHEVKKYKDLEKYELAKMGKTQREIKIIEKVIKELKKEMKE